MRMLAPYRPQQPQLVALQAMNARRAVLGAADMDGRGHEINLLPTHVDELADPQCMPEGQKDQQPVADRVTAVAGSGQQAIDLGFRQILALPVFGILGPTTTYCRLFRLRWP